MYYGASQNQEQKNKKSKCSIRAARSYLGAVLQKFP